MLLIFPPIFRPAEPPAGIARLAGFLKSRGVPCRPADLNYRFFSDMIENGGRAVLFSGTEDTYTRRAYKNKERNLELIRSPEGYTTIDRYIKVVHELNRAVTSSVPAGSVSVSLSDYSETGKNPLQSRDLIAAFLRPESSPLFHWFAPVLDDLLQADSPAGPGPASVTAAGLSLCFISQALPAFAMAGYLKKTAPGIRIVLGGGLVTSWMRLPDWKNPFSGIIDHLIQGRGEEELLAWVSSDLTEEEPGNGNQQEEDACVLANKYTASSVRARTKPFIFALPDYTALRENRYLSPGFILPYAASSGCSWKRCRFCPEYAEQGAYHTPSPGETIGQLSALLHETDAAAIHFLDSEMSPSLLRALSDNPRTASDLPAPAWYGFARFHEDLADTAYCMRLRDAGCVMLKLGLESGSQSVLDKSGKGITLSLAANVLRALKAAGIGIYLYLLFGTPWESYDEAMETLDFTAMHADNISFLNLALFNMPRGGALSGEYETRPFGDGDLSLYTDFMHPRGWDRTRVRRFIENEFRHHPAVSPIVRRQPPFFGSSHGAFLPIE